MALFESKEKKLKRQQAEEDAKANAEFEAKFAAKTEKKKVEKTIAEVDKSLQILMNKAAEAKSKGYEDVYRQCVGMIKITKGRKIQAEKFLFQMDAMQEIQNVSKNSMELLGSMNNIMSSLGKLSLLRLDGINIILPSLDGIDLQYLVADRTGHHKGLAKLLSELCGNEYSVFGIYAMLVFTRKHRSKPPFATVCLGGIQHLGSS
jgi:hypothetical protein